MIRNERQYRVTLSERDRLLAELAEGKVADVPGWILAVTREALTSQVLEMDDEIAEYEALRSGAAPAATQVADLSELPRALVSARIASHLTQRDLAERLGLREQQIQRYEANDYAGASISRLEEVMQALNVTFRGEVSLPSVGANGGALRRNLTDMGLSKATLSRRFFGGDIGGTPTAGWMHAAARAARIFRADINDVLAGRIPTVANAGAFRASRAANRETVNGYARYAEYLGELLTRACTVDYQPLPDLPAIRSQLADQLVDKPLYALTRLCWQHGVPILPLSDPGSFYGACWQVSGRPVIALKHGVRSPDRWAFLLAHEVDHARNPSEEPVIEADLEAREWRELPSEQAADDFASQLLLSDAAEAMLHVAVDQANGDIARLKSVLPAVAAAGEVSVGLLADYAATRIGAQGINWWPTANRLHESEEDAWTVCRSILFEYVDFSRLDALDREILIDGIGI
ncbi:helix-turn-helix transcriptional regulator [Kribbella sp. VKM Ac-2566]|uniref:helix-turn-helix domain-containing protein n=1 Tax=Kribbella sp. VKM Ac-2566 TaxID=2512218 RepID=UPI001062C17A|nr:helix-turn-helix transcriptional regulator [Kribbella sp. VKM Ac-2566]TDX04023.1 helix-turn-helix protein [Kribbella sp. VKM Ac-2566]